MIIYGINIPGHFNPNKKSYHFHSRATFELIFKPEKFLRPKMSPMGGQGHMSRICLSNDLDVSRYRIHKLDTYTIPSGLHNMYKSAIIKKP